MKLKHFGRLLAAAGMALLLTGCAKRDPIDVDELVGKQEETTVAETMAEEETSVTLHTVEETTEAAPTEPETEPVPEEITLLFAGDVYFSNHVMNAYNQAGGITGVLDDAIRQEIEAADIFMVNQEFPFTDRGEPVPDKQFNFRVPMERASILTEMGVDIVTLANNHILDYGPVGITDSITALDGQGILHVGAGEDLEEAKKAEFIEVNGKTIGFLGTSRVYMATDWAAGEGHPGVFSTYDPTLPLKEIEEVKKQCDYLVVFVHWGIERNTEPENYQRVMGKQYIDAGADIVVGSHPHVLQEIEDYEGKPIIYSLGNFVFGSRIPETELVKVILSEDGMDVTTIPLTSSAGFTRIRE